MSLWTRITNAFRTERVNREIDEELQSHIDDARAAGRDLTEVRRAFGSALRAREASRDLRVLPWLDSLRADAIFGWHRLLATKVTSAAAILSLALAIGACTSAFRLIDALLFRPLPIANPERLHVVAFRGAHALDGKMFTYDSCSYPVFQKMRDRVREQADLIAVSYAGRADLTYSSDADMEKAFQQFVSGSMFQTFAIQPAAGRLFTSNDDVTPGAHPAAVLSYDYWTRRFGSDPKAVGRTFRIADTLYEIVGVASEGFTGTETGTPTDVFIPMMMKNPRTLLSPDNFWLRTLVQLHPAADPQLVEQKLASVFNASREERAKGFTSMPKARLEAFFQEKLLLESAAAGRSNLQRDYRQSLMALSVLVALVLLIACANVANLMTARAAARTREMALRVSIGAGRMRLMQLVLVESAWIAILATCIGAVFAWWSAPFIIGLVNSPDNPARLLLPADWRVLAFALALTLGVTFLFGLSPALRASSVKPSSALKGGEDPRTRRRLMHALIAAQVAFCFLVIFVAGLFVTSFDRLSHQPLGYSAARVLNLEALSRRPQPRVYWDQVADHLRALPGVESVAISAWPLMSGESGVANVSINGTPPSDIFSDNFAVTSGWLETMKVTLLNGRDLRPNDAPEVAVVNEAFARQYFNGEDPVGRFFERMESGGARARYEIIGMVRDVRYRDNLRIPIRPTFFFPLRPWLSRGTFVVRTASADALSLAASLRQEVPRAHSELRVSNIRTQTEIVESKTIRERLLAMLALFFAAVALALAGVGLYGVLDYTVLQQRREIGIRLAIGARGADITQQVTLPVFAMVLTGSLVGLGLGTASVRFIEALLYQSKATDLGILALPCLAILASSVLAALPAVVRALRVDPVEMLRAE